MLTSAAWQSRAPKQGIATLLAGLAIAQSFDSINAPIMSPDEALLIVYPDRVAEGAIPHRDFVSVSGAIVNYVYASVYAIFGTSVFAERGIGILYHIIIVVCVYLLCRRDSIGIGLVGGMFSLLFLDGLGAGAYAYLGGVALLVSALATLETERRTACLVSGILAGFAIGWRYDLVIGAALIALPLMRKRERAVQYFLGVSIGAVPTLIHLLIAGESVIDNIILNRARANFQVHPDLNDAWVYVVGAMCVAAPIVFFTMAIASSAPIWLGRGGLSLALLPQMLQRLDAIHVAYVACVSIPLLAAAGLGILRHHSGLRMIPVPGVVASLVALAVAGNVVTSVTHQPRTVWVHHAGRALPMPDRAMAESVETMVRTIERLGDEDSTIFSGAQDMSRPTGNFMAIYILLHRHTINAYYLELLPGLAERHDSGLAQDIAKSDFLILASITREETELLYPNIGAGSDQANAVVRNCFTRVATDRAFQLYRKRTSLPSGCD